MKSFRRLLKNRSGFTLGEVMICMLILLLITAVVAGAIPAAGSAYRNAVDAANAQTLLSTAISALRDEFSTAGLVSVTVPEGGGDATTCTVTYRRAATYSLTRLRLVAEDGFWIQDYVDPDSTWEKTKSEDPDSFRRLVSRETATANLYLDCDGIVYDAETGVITFQNLTVKRPGTAQPLASADGLSIRVIDPS